MIRGSSEETCTEEPLKYLRKMEGKFILKYILIVHIECCIIIYKDSVIVIGKKAFKILTYGGFYLLDFNFALPILR